MTASAPVTGRTRFRSSLNASGCLAWRIRSCRQPKHLDTSCIRAFAACTIARRVPVRRSCAPNDPVSCFRRSCPGPNIPQPARAIRHRVSKSNRHGFAWKRSHSRKTGLPYFSRKRAPRRSGPTEFQPSVVPKGVMNTKESKEAHVGQYANVGKAARYCNLGSRLGYSFVSRCRNGLSGPSARLRAVCCAKRESFCCPCACAVPRFIE